MDTTSTQRIDIYLSHLIIHTNVIKSKLLISNLLANVLVK
jgi:hypothetical protein